MTRKSDVRYFGSKHSYFTTWQGTRYKLAEGPDDKPNGPTFLAALEKFREIMELSTAGSAGDKNPVRVIFEQFLRFIAERRAANTVKIRQQYLVEFAAFENYGSMAVRDLKHHHVYTWLNHAKKERTWQALGGKVTRKTSWRNETIKLALESLTHAFNWAMRTGHFYCGPTHHSLGA